MAIRGCKPYLGSVSVTGPFDASGAPPAAETPSRQRIFVCQPAPEADDAQTVCARQIIERLARRAYRRPVMPGDVDVLLGFFDEGRADGGFDAGIEMALRWLLASPEFVLRVERDPPGIAPGTNYAVSNLELASRLSFFLWSSLPDDELLDLAVAGRLRDPQVLERQTRRMLADDRADALVTNFASQWLYLRNVPAFVPDEDRFPDFGDALRQAMRRETELFVGSVFREDRSVLDLLTADYTFVNERLARHYGIPHVYGGYFRRVTLADDARRGLLGHASILAVTSYPNRTSPVLRGKWVLENLLGTPPASPPPDVPALEETGEAGAPLSMREATERHRANPVCASCHRLMDPPGFALEQFDAVGRFRTRTAANTPIDATGQLPDGTVFDGAAGLRAALVAHPDRFVGTLTEKLMTYALGRGLEHYDAPTIRAITRDAASDGYRFTSLIVGIVNSPAFTMRRSSVNVGDPPALPGRHPGFDSSGREMGKLPRVSRSSITQGSPHDELSQSKPHEMGVPVPRRFHPEVPEESHLRGVARVPRGSIAPVGAAAGERGGRRASAGRPRPHVVVNSAETLGGAGDRIYQREERDSHCPGVRGSAAQFRRAALLGPRLLCVHSGSR